MAKIQGIYQDKKTKKWFFSASLGADATTGRRIQKVKRGFKTQREAYEARINLLKEAPDIGQLSNNQMTYLQFVEEVYIPEYENRVEETTFRSRAAALNKVKNHFGKKKVRDITALEIQQWKSSLIKNYSQNYARIIYLLFSNSLDLAVKLGMVNKNRAKQVGSISKGKTKVDFWTKSDFERVLATFNLNIYYQHYSFVMLWVYFMTGLRVNEATALTWERDVDLDNRTLTVNYSLRMNNVNDWEFGPTKTSGSQRTIALDRDTIKILKDWKERQQAIGEIDFVFSYNGNPSVKNSIRCILRRHARMAGVKAIQLKGLRHSHVSLLINEQNVNPLIIKERLGHEDIKTTLGTYSHLYDNTNFEVAEKLCGIFEL